MEEQKNCVRQLTISLRIGMVSAFAGPEMGGGDIMVTASPDEIVRAIRDLIRRYPEECADLVERIADSR